jgi:hypothetical protein
VNGGRVGKGALLDLSAWAKSRSRRAHAARRRQPILPTLQSADEVMQ